jgi:hypothetical protein
MAAIISASAMSYSQAREQAWFLTDKMAYELYLTAAQVDAVYEINLDYIMNVDFMGDIFGTFWERRTKELSYVLTRSQMHTFLATEHFFRPISWVNSSFHFVIYDRYPTRTHFYYSAPKVYTTYKGEHRKSTDSRFKGKFEDVKPNVTGRTLSTRTGVSTTTNKGGFTSENKGTVTNGRTKPSDNMSGMSNNRTGANVTNSGNSSTRSGGTSIRTEATKPSVATATSASTIGSTRTASTTKTATVSGSSRSASTTSNATVSGSSRSMSTSNRTATVSGSSRTTSNGSSTNARRH